MKTEEKKELRKSWEGFISSKKWDLYLTIQYPSGCNYNSNRNVMQTIFDKNISVNRMCWFSERNKDYINVHCHSLLYCQNINSVKISLDYLNSFANVDLKIFDDSLKDLDGKSLVARYVTKFVTEGNDYDFFNRNTST